MYHFILAIAQQQNVSWMFTTTMRCIYPCIYPCIYHKSAHLASLSHGSSCNDVSLPQHCHPKMKWAKPNDKQIFAIFVISPTPTHSLHSLGVFVCFFLLLCVFTSVLLFMLLLVRCQATLSLIYQYFHKFSPNHAPISNIFVFLLSISMCLYIACMFILILTKECLKLDIAENVSVNIFSTVFARFLFGVFSLVYLPHCFHSSTAPQSHGTLLRICTTIIYIFIYGKTNFLWCLSINENGDTFCFICILTVHRSPHT